jgi:hypothetical protein
VAIRGSTVLKIHTITGASRFYDKYSHKYCSKWFNVVQNSSTLFKMVQRCSILFSVVKTLL